MEKVLVTGASGHLGGAVARKLLARGVSVRALVRPSSSLAGLKDASGNLLPGLEPALGDVLDRETFGAAMRGCATVFHLAAVFKTRQVDEALMERTALEGTRNLMELAAGQEPRPRIVYTSSVAAMGCSRRSDQVLDEAAWNQAPIDAYVASKAGSERLAWDLAAGSGLWMVAVNPGTVLGAGDYTPTPSNAFILLAMKKGTPVYFDGGHSYTDVEDVAEGHLLAWEKGRPGQRYILAGENVSMRDTLERIARLTGGRRPLFKIGHAFVSVAGLGFEALSGVTGKPPLFTRAKAHQLIDYYGYFSSDKARRELGYRFRGFDEILGRARDWYRERGWL